MAFSLSPTDNIASVTRPSPAPTISSVGPQALPFLWVTFQRQDLGSPELVPDRISIDEFSQAPNDALSAPLIMRIKFLDLSLLRDRLTARGIITSDTDQICASDFNGSPKWANSDSILRDCVRWMLQSSQYN